MSDVPADYGTYAAGRSEPRFTDWLRARSEPAWSDAVDGRFVREFGAGTLEEAVFADYLVQDYVVVDALVAAFGHAVGQAPDMAARRPLVTFLETVTDEENDYFRRAFEALEVPAERRDDPEPTATTAAFCDLLGRAAREGGYAETLAVLVPAEWVYESWAAAVAADHGDGTSPPSAGADLPFYYAEWVDLHAVPSFVEFVAWLRGQLDDVGPALSPRRRRRVERLFTRTVELEAAFFEAAVEADG